MTWIVNGLAAVLNVTIAFATDGHWKTAGTGIVHLYWKGLGAVRQTA
jgi:hypothetical protein